jgi:hypothetical protein
VQQLLWLLLIQLQEYLEVHTLAIQYFQFTVQHHTMVMSKNLQLKNNKNNLTSHTKLVPMVTDLIYLFVVASRLTQMT